MYICMWQGWKNFSKLLTHGPSACFISIIEFPPDTCVFEWNISLVLVLADNVEFLKLTFALQWLLVLYILYCYCHSKTI